MKHYILLFCFVATVFSCSVANAQSTPKPPKWMSNKGYWIIENNVNTPKQSIVYYYNNEHHLVLKQFIDGKLLNVNKKKVCKSLEATLVQSVNNWEKQQSAVKN